VNSFVFMDKAVGPDVSGDRVRSILRSLDVGPHFLAVMSADAFCGECFDEVDVFRSKATSEAEDFLTFDYADLVSYAHLLSQDWNVILVVRPGTVIEPIVERFARNDYSGMLQSSDVVGMFDIEDGCAWRFSGRCGIGLFTNQSSEHMILTEADAVSQGAVIHTPLEELLSPSP